MKGDLGVSLVQLVPALAKKWKVEPKVAKEFITEFIEIVLAHVKQGNKAEVHGLGVFYRKNPGLKGAAAKIKKTERATGYTLMFRETRKLRNYFFEDCS